MVEFVQSLETLSASGVYPSILGILLLCGLGLPLPEDIVLITAGYLAASGVIDHWTVTLVCFVGVFLGDGIIFSLGRRYGEGILDTRLMRRLFPKKRMERASYAFEKHGQKVVFFARFVAGVRAPVFLISGILKMKARTFFLLDGIAALISVPFFVWLGFTMADNLEHAIILVRRSQHTLLLVLAVAVLAVVAYQVYLALERAASERAVRKYEEQHPEAGEKAHILPQHMHGVPIGAGGGDGKSMAIFKAYDIRGKVPSELDEDLARRIGWAIAKHLSVPEIVVGQDVRGSSPVIADALCRGILQTGTRVLDLGRSSTPLTNFAVGVKGLGGGVMVTASHNPPEYNGFKISRAGAIPVYDEEIRRIGALAVKEAPKDARLDGGIGVMRSPLSVREEFIRRVVERARPGARRLKVVADLSHGAATIISPEIFGKLPHEFVILNGVPDGTFPSHPPDPLKEENLEQARVAILENRADLGCVYDGDSDRIVFLDETGKTVTGDLATLLMALDLIETSGEKGAVVFYDVRSSRIVREKLKAVGADPRQSRVGHAFIKTAMREARGLCGGELSGHYYFRDNFNAENSDLALVLLLNLLAKEGRPLSKVVAPYRCYFPSGEISMEVADKQAAMEKVSAHYAEGAQSRLDGLTVEFDDWWFNLRPSNTEPLLRLNVESIVSGEEMARHRDEILALIGA